MTLDQIEKIMDSKDFWVHKYDDMFGAGEPGWEFGQMTPCGEDWIETVESDDADTLLNSLIRRLDGWDSEEEAKIWFESAGKNGVPGIRDLLDDADWKEETLRDLVAAIQETPDEEDEIEESKDIKTEAPEDDVDLENSDDVDKLADEVEPTKLDEIITEWEAKSPLHERIIEEIIDDSEGYDGDKLAQIKGRLGDISYGLVNGTVGSLIYYDDTNKFFEEYYDDIWEVVQEWSEQGVEPLEALKRNCDEVEIIMGTDNFKCWVVWMVYEEIAYLFGEALDEINSEEQVSA